MAAMCDLAVDGRGYRLVIWIPWRGDGACTLFDGEFELSKAVISDARLDDWSRAGVPSGEPMRQLWATAVGEIADPHEQQRAAVWWESRRQRLVASISA